MGSPGRRAQRNDGARHRALWDLPAAHSSARSLRSTDAGPPIRPNAHTQWVPIGRRRQVTMAHRAHPLHVGSSARYLDAGPPTSPGPADGPASATTPGRRASAASNSPIGSGVTVGLGVSDAGSSSDSPLPSSGQAISGASSNSMPAATITASSSDPGTLAPRQLPVSRRRLRRLPLQRADASFSARRPGRRIHPDYHPGVPRRGAKWSGASGLRSPVSGPGACTVTLSEPQTVQSPVEYTLTITPGAR